MLFIPTPASSPFSSSGCHIGHEEERDKRHPSTRLVTGQRHHSKRPLVGTRFIWNKKAAPGTFLHKMETIDLVASGGMTSMFSAWMQVEPTHTSWFLVCTPGSRHGDGRGMGGVKRGHEAARARGMMRRKRALQRWST